MKVTIARAVAAGKRAGTSPYSISGSGNLGVFAISLALPLFASVTISADQYKFWVLLSSQLVLSATFDFGAAALINTNAAQSTLSFRTFCIFVCAAVAGSVVVTLSFALFLQVSKQGSSALFLLVGLNFLCCASRDLTLCAVSALAGRGKYAVQSLVLVAMAGATAGVAVPLLAFRPGEWVVVASSAAGAVVAWAFLAMSYRRRDLQFARRETIPAVKARSASLSQSYGGIVASLLSQGDRWVLSVILNPAIFTAYDLAARFGALPRYGVATINSVMIGQISRNRGAASSAFRSAVKICSAFSFVLVVGVLGTALIIDNVSGLPVRLDVLAANLVSGGSFAAAVPISLLFLAKGKAHLDFIPNHIMLGAFSIFIGLGVVIDSSIAMFAVAGALAFGALSRYLVLRHNWGSLL